jgi:thiol reductant ABC exporter CydC subunit
VTGVRRRVAQDPAVRLLRLARPAAGRLALVLAASAGGVLCAVGLAATAAWMLATAAGQPPVLTLAVAVVTVRACGLGRGVLRYVERLLGHDAAFRVLATIRGLVWARLEPLVPGGLAGARGGDLLTRIVDDVDAVQDLYLRALAPPVVAVVVGGACTALAAHLLPAAGAVLGLLLALSALALPLAVLAAERDAVRHAAPSRGELSSIVVESLEGAEELTAYGAVRAAVHRAAEVDQRLTAHHRRFAWVAGLADGLHTALTGTALIGVLGVGLPAVAAGTLDGVALAVLALTALAAAEVVAPLPDAARALARSRAAGARLFALLDQPPPVPEPVRRLPLPRGGALEVEGLTVRHPGSLRPALRGVSLRLEPGRRLAVVGPSGSGKSTLVDALLRFVEPEDGRILLGGVDVRDCATDDVRSVVAGALQRPHTFSTSLRENVLLARPDACAGELDAAADLAGLTDWILELPRGWDTPAGQDGRVLSGGQSQRISLARALLAKTPVLLLDEPTAGLDVEVADDITRRLIAATTSQSLVLVTHRLTGLAAMDEIVVLDDGAVVERGTHADLIGRDGPYADLWRAERDADELAGGPRVSETTAA